MKIENLKINAFGNLENKEIDLSDGINIIYGKNEAGKSTLLKFIVNSLYGTSKNKKGREYSDYDRYKPWTANDFSGKIKYKLDNGETYEVFREFGKKNPKIFNENMEDISKNFTIDKNLGNQFFYEQTKIDEPTFLATIAAMQQEVKIEKGAQNVLVQKMANIAGTGDDNVSYKKATEILYKKQLDEIGTSRSQGKPINVVQSKINNLKHTKNDLLGFKNEKFSFEEKKNIVEDEIAQEQLKLDLIKKVRKLDETEAIQTEKLNYNVSLIKKDEREILNLINEKNRILDEYGIDKEADLIDEYNKKINSPETEENIENTKFKVKILKYIIAVLLFTGINAGIIYFLKSNLKFACLADYLLIAIAYIIERRKLKHKAFIKDNKNVLNRKLEDNKNLDKFEKNKTALERVNIVNAKIEVFEKDKRDQLKIMEETKNKLRTSKEQEIEKIRNSYSKKIDINEIDRLLGYEDINTALEEVTNEINEKKLELHRIELSKNNIMPQLENLARVDEELSVAEQEYDDLVKKNASMSIVKDVLESAYSKMKNDVTPKFTTSLSKNIEEISDGKYNKVSVNDENGLMVELQSGDYISADRLSIGTIDQLYLSLRLSMNEEVSNENMPVILDEAFAYYDDSRLENILNYLIRNFGNKQILIFTCTSREENILKKLAYNYNKIEL